MSTTEFLKKIKSGAILGWERHRILPSITGAQGILEGASGTSKLSQAPYYNQFGIKVSPDWTGKKVKMMTWEEIGGRKVNVEAEFRWYDSIEESVADHASFFTSTEWRKNNYKAVVGEKDYRKAARALQNAGYATDSQYANKLIRLIETHGLRSWDEEAFSGSVAPTLAPVSSEGAMITPTTETDVVGRYNIEDLEYKDDLLHSPKGESVIYNPTLNDAYGFQTKSGDVLWIDHVLEVNSEDPQEIMDEAVKYMKENAQPDAQYRVKLKHLPDNISIGDTGMFVDHKFNPPLYIEARILEIVTSISNPENDSVVVGNVREVKSQTDESIRALQKELQDTREKLVDDYFAQKELEVSIRSNNGLALIDTGVTHAIELIAEPQNEIKLVANTPYKINLNAPVGANVDTYTLTGELLNNTFTAEFEDVVNPIVVEPEPVIDETLISGIVGSDNHGATVESPQGDKVAIVDSAADFTGLRVKELNFKFYDATGALVHEEDVPVNINSKISHSVFKEGVIFASMAITSKADVTVKGLSFKEPSIFGDGAKTTDLMAYFNFDIPHNYIWTRVSDDDDADLLWNDRNKFNNSNNLKITIEDINGGESTFILTVYDENGNVIAGTSETVKVDKSPDKISAEVEEAILNGGKIKEMEDLADELDQKVIDFQERVGSDGKPQYNKNRSTISSAVSRGELIPIKHNGLGYVAGKDMVLSFKASCVPITQSQLTLNFTADTLLPEPTPKTKSAMTLNLIEPGGSVPIDPVDPTPPIEPAPTKFGNARVVNLSDYGGIGDGATDNFDAFKRVIDDSVNEPLVLKIDDGNYFVEGATNSRLEPWPLKSKGLRIEGTGNSANIYHKNNRTNQKHEYYFMQIAMTEDSLGFEVENITLDGIRNPQEELFYTQSESNPITNIPMARGFAVNGAHNVLFNNVTFKNMYGGYGVLLEEYRNVNITNTTFDKVGGNDIQESFGMAIYLGGHTGDAVVNIDNVHAQGMTTHKDLRLSWIGVVLENGTIQSSDPTYWMRDKNTTVNITNSSFIDYQSTFHVESVAGNVYWNVDNLETRASNYQIVAGVYGEYKEVSNNVRMDMVPYGRLWGIVKGLYYSEAQELEDNWNGHNMMNMYNSVINLIKVDGFEDPVQAVAYGSNVTGRLHNSQINDLPHKLVSNGSALLYNSEVNLAQGSNETRQSLQNGHFSDAIKQRVEFNNTNVNPYGSHKNVTFGPKPAFAKNEGFVAPFIDLPIQPPI